MTVAVVVPWRPGCPHRQAALDWVLAAYASHHPDWDVVLGTSAEGPFSRSQAILDAAHRTDADVVVVADSDVWVDPDAMRTAVEASVHGWAIPHTLIHRLSPESTAKVLGGADWRGLPLSTDNTQDRRPYRGHETGTLVVFRRDVLDDVSPDPRFVGWGAEDDAWAYALRCLAGPPWRGPADLVHLWHPPQPRLSRRVGSRESRALLERYRRARRDPDAMRALVDEAARARQDAAA